MASERYDKAFSRLIACYLETIEGSKAIPIFSPLPVIKLYLKMLRWEFCFFFIAPAFLILHGIRRLVLRRKVRLWGTRFVRWATEPFLAIHRGEITAVRFISMRSIVRLLLYYRIVTALSKLRYRLQELRIHQHLLREDATLTPKWFEERLHVIQDVKEIASKRLGFAIWSSLVGLATAFGVIKKAFELIPKETLQRLITALKEQLPDWLLHVGGAQSLMHSPFWLSAATSISMYLILVYVSNFSLLRSLAESQSMYFKECKEFDVLGIPRRREIPGDIIGLILALCVWAGATFYRIKNRDVLDILLIEFLIFTALFLYVLLRRMMRSRQLLFTNLSHRDSDQAIPAYAD